MIGKSFFFMLCMSLLFSVVSCSKKNGKHTTGNDAKESPSFMSYEERLQQIRDEVKNGTLNLTAALKTPWKTISQSVKSELGARKFRQIFPNENNEFKKGDIPVVYHVDGKYRRDELFPIPPKGTLIENRFDKESVSFIADKGKLLDALKQNRQMSNYLLKQWSYNHGTDSLEEILDKSFNQCKYLIIKPSDGFGGNGILIAKKGDDIEKIRQHIDSFANNKEGVFMHWVFQEYLGEPMLYKGKKFHFRMYLTARRMGNNVSVFSYPEGWMYVAAKEYGTADDALANIDDSPRHLTNIKLGGHEHLYPKDINDLDFNGIKGSEVAKYITSQINILLYESSKDIKYKLTCRYKDELMCFETFGVDLIIDNKFNLKLLEYNSGTGYGANYKYDFAYGVCWEKEFIAATYRKTVDVALGLTKGIESKADICRTQELQELTLKRTNIEKAFSEQFRLKFPELF